MLPKQRSSSFALAGLAVIVVALGLLGYAQFTREGAGVASSGKVTTSGTALVGGPFSLIDGAGARRTDSEFRGRLMLVFFGFTHCPDICPTALGQVSVALDTLGPLADKVQPVFITVDPERDTPAVIGEYVAAFSPRILGLTGSAEDIAAAAKLYKAYYKKVPLKDSASGYTMDHSAIIYVMGPDGAYRSHFSHGTDPDTMAAKLKSLIADMKG